MKTYYQAFVTQYSQSFQRGFSLLSNPKQSAKSLYHHFMTDSLYRNSLYLMMSTMIMAFFGFFFWTINARIFSSEQIGLATVLISSMGLISNFSLLGLNLGLVRYLPQSKRKTDKINTVITVVLLATLVASLIYLSGLSIFAPKILFLRENIVFLFVFIVLTIFFTLDSLYTNVFVAYRNTKYILYKSVLGNIFKVSAPFLLLGLGTYAIFISATIGTVVTALFSGFILYRLYGYRFRLTVKKNILIKMSKLSFGNYLASFVASLPVTLLPIMITNNLGAKQAAFFYMDMMIVNLLGMVQYSLNQSLFAEGSNNDKNLKENVIKSLKLNALLLLPAIGMILLLGKHVLLIFGQEYSSEGATLLYLMSFATLFVSVNGTLSAILNIKGKVHLILIMCVIGATILLTFSYLAIPYGLETLGYAWLIGEALVCLIYLSMLSFIFKFSPSSLRAKKGEILNKDKGTLEQNL